MKLDIDKILISCGFVGPIIFFLTIYFLFPLFYPGYDIMNQTISELGSANSPVKTLANVLGFSLFGIFIMLFSFGLFRLRETNVIGKIAAFFIFAAGIMMYLVGIFYGSASGDYSQIDILHMIFANYQFPVFAVGLVLFAFSISNNEKLKLLTPVILALGIITLILAYNFFFAYDLQNRGIWQRAAIGLPYAIMAIIAIGLYRIKLGK